MSREERREAAKAAKKTAKKAMAVALKLLVIGSHPALHTAATPVVDLPDALTARQTIKTMMDALTPHTTGVGLAAPQIGVSKQIIIIWPERRHGAKPIVMVNPEYTDKSTEMAISSEGCLSFPGVYADFTRHERVVITWTDLDTNERISRTFEGFAAFVVQHEMDHLAGVCKVHLTTTGWTDSDLERVRAEQMQRAEIKRKMEVRTQESVTLTSSGKVLDRPFIFKRDLSAAAALLELGYGK